MPHATSEPEPAIARKVLAYFVRNRKAADTVEGITRWRLSEEQVNRNLQQVEVAVSWLVEQGLLEEVRPESSEVPVFRLNQSRHAEAIQYLADKSER